jgi:hypothetical protein
MRTLSLVMIVLLVALGHSASAQVYEAGLGAGVLSFNSGGEALTKHSGGVSLDAGIGWEIDRGVLVFGRLLATSGIEDEQHAHDDVVLAATLRGTGPRLWGEAGLGLGFYRGRYRYMTFFSADSAYDGDIATPTALFGGGVTLYRRGELAIDTHVNVSLSLFGGEVPFVSGAHLLVGVRWQR